MKVLIESYKYQADDVRGILHGINTLENIEGYVVLNYVGYFYNTELKDCVFILPKVLLEDKYGEEKVFGKYSPKDIINIDDYNSIENFEKNVIYEFAVWIYRSIVVFKDSHKDSNIVYHKKIIQLSKGRKRLSNTFLEILLALLDFNRNNQDFFFFILRNLHSGYNKINWTRTIAKSNAIVQDNAPIYLNPINKKRTINFDEELLVIFFSILNYISEHYGFEVNINCNFNLIKGKEFEVYIKSLGKARLQKIKYKYFSDKALELWELCYAFFDNATKIQTNTTQKEYLLVKNFNIVFEAIIDELIGDKDIPKGLKEQEDGKRVDHMYTYKGLTNNEEDKDIYYIGDSKYYKRNSEVGKKSIYKQLTYARNVIQWNLNLFMNEENEDNEWKERAPILRDDVTEGYNVIPNFFISARLNKDLSYKDDEITARDNDNDEPKFFNKHFENRLFDRDTLLVCHYDVNFLYVVSLYARNNALQKSTWKTKVRELFRENIQKILKSNFEFYAMSARPNVNAEQCIKENFQEVLGKVYSPYSNKEIFSLAFDRNDKYAESKQTLLNKLRKYFYIESCEIGTIPENVLAKHSNAATSKEVVKEALALCITKEGANFDNALETIKRTRKVGIALNATGATLQLVEGFTSAKYLIIHNKSNKWLILEMEEKGPIFVAKDELQDMVVTKKDSPLYLVYSVKDEKELDFGELDLSCITKSGSSYSPHLCPINDLLKF